MFVPRIADGEHLSQYIQERTAENRVIGSSYGRCDERLWARQQQIERQKKKPCRRTV